MPLFGSGKKDLETIAQELNDDTDAQRRIDAVIRLLELYDDRQADLPGVLQHLLRRLSVDRDEAVLGQINSGIVAIAEVELENDDERVAMQNSLGDASVDEAFRLAVERLRGGEDQNVLTLLCNSLAMFQEAESYFEIVGTIYHGRLSDPEQFKQVIDFLVWMGDPGFIRPLAEAVKRHGALSGDASGRWSGSALTELTLSLTEAAKTLGQDLVLSLKGDLSEGANRGPVIVTGIPPSLGLDLFAAEGLRVNEWDTLQLRLTNKTELPLQGIEIVRVDGPVEIEGGLPEIEGIPVGETRECSFSLKPTEAGRQVHLRFDVTFAPWITPPGDFEGGYECEDTLDLYVTVAAVEESKTPINQTIQVQGSYYAGPTSITETKIGGDVLESGASKVGEGVMISKSTPGESGPSRLKYCPHCGGEINLPETPRFCSQCGKALGE